MRASQRAHNVRYYAINRLAEIARVTTRQRATLAWLRDLRSVPCADCGLRFAPQSMDFDHRNPASKRFQITTGRALLKSRAELLTEIAKCDIVCANCHRLRTIALFISGELRDLSFYPSDRIGTDQQMRGRARFRQRWSHQIDLLRKLRDCECLDCGRAFGSEVMQFDHRDPNNKVRNVTLMAERVSDRRLHDEVAKCDIVCVNCHRVRTHARRQVAGVL